MKKPVVLMIGLFLLVSMTQVEKTLYKTIGGKQVFEVKDKQLFVFSSGMMIDADGSPNAYHKNNQKALDFLANAGRPGNWWALVTDNGKTNGNPVIQTVHDPSPGFYISTTTLEDAGKDTRDPARYVNAEKTPYIALPGKLSKDFNPGDIAYVINTANNKKSAAIFADIGPADKIGEGSIYLAKQLGIESSPKDGGVTSGIVYILFKNSGKGLVLSNEEIQLTCDKLLAKIDLAAVMH